VEQLTSDIAINRRKKFPSSFKSCAQWYWRRRALENFLLLLQFLHFLSNFYQENQIKLEKTYERERNRGGELERIERKLVIGRE